MNKVLTSGTALLKKGAESIGLELRANRFSNPFKLQQRLIGAASPLIFDVGAHVGLTCKAYRELFPDARVYAFEPFPESHSKLVRTVAEDAGITVFQLALSDSCGHRTFHVNPAEATNSLLPTDPSASRVWGAGLLESQGTIEVESQTLDAFCSERGIVSIDILKIDVQGAEYAVLQGARALLQARAIGLVYFEVILAATYRGQHRLHEYLQLMDSHDYCLLDYFNPVRKDGRLLQFDLLFAAPAIASA
ncbi:MAG: FkbM family methyltransferase [Lautropia sp.]